VVPYRYQPLELCSAASMETFGSSTAMRKPHITAKSSALRDLFHLHERCGRYRFNLIDSYCQSKYNSAFSAGYKNLNNILYL
jgi:hypothetical protein